MTSPQEKRLLAQQIVTEIPGVSQVVIGGFTTSEDELFVVVPEEEGLNRVYSIVSSRFQSQEMRVITERDLRKFEQDPRWLSNFSFPGQAADTRELPQGEWMARNLTRISNVLTRAAARTSIIVSPRDRETTEKNVRGAALEISIAQEFTSVRELVAEYARLENDLDTIAVARI